MVAGTPWVASCTVSVDGDQVEHCSGPEAADALAYAAFGDHGTREFFTHVRFHKHDGDRSSSTCSSSSTRARRRRQPRCSSGRTRRPGDHLTGRGVAPPAASGMTSRTEPAPERPSSLHRGTSPWAKATASAAYRVSATV